VNLTARTGPEAWDVLGLSPADGWDAVRPAYRRMIAELHPDRAGAALTSRAARVNRAYAVLSRARRRGGAPSDSHAPAPSRSPGASPPPASSPPAWEGLVDPGEVTVLRLPLSPDSAFVRLLAAGDAIGDIGYTDRSSGVLEVLVAQDGEVCSLLLTLEARGEATDVVVALEAMARVASLPPGPVVHRLLRALDTGRD
jgi:hypothetical protein